MDILEYATFYDKNINIIINNIDQLCLSWSEKKTLLENIAKLNDIWGDIFYEYQTPEQIFEIIKAELKKLDFSANQRFQVEKALQGIQREIEFVCGGY